ncbi:uncharacterized protein LOC114281515 isoform X6 [Camellia sinensis]|uniref:uncharacterized protein LOC114281515 isoform X6 n=1 Tax=Camellia sinensis TaxID=4442 RepID=UPI0010356CF4|nr:uncharacterized protein LOC114281515 isoform X6 [Camellia sinensis]
MFAMERWCSLSRSISGGRGHKSLGRVGMAMGDPMGSNPNIYGFFSLFFTTGLMKWVFKISIEYGSGMGTRPFPHMLGFSFSISLSHSSEGNNLHRFCKGNDLAAAISVGVTTVVLQRELLLHRVVGTLLQLAKPVEETYASISRKYATSKR